MGAITGLPPIARVDAKLLILGSMPGRQSLEKRQYYAHPRNGFWPIMSRLFDAHVDLDYLQRQKLLLKHRIALWDVLRQCHRKGSLDAAIISETVKVNDFERFFSRHPEISVICFNGTRAEQLFKPVRLKMGQTNLLQHYHRLPSTSPAHANMRLNDKYDQWKIVRRYLKEMGVEKHRGEGR